MRKHDCLIGTILESRPLSFLAVQYCTLNKRKMGKSLSCRFPVHPHDLVVLGLSSGLHDILDYFVKPKIQNYFYLPPPSAPLPPPFWQSKTERLERGGPCLLLKLKEMGTQGVQVHMKRVLSRLVC